ncbi:dihydrodipicolinate synthase family protein [Amycolatopsis kentuckyensis]|uniref:dihydrodipicolinate synthase family protein n=1 Tax=Amycolatopsis kentuckyensis TaxID=218823 RepID=UPI000A3C0EA9|nr:dihydrodipicolinate synthase family protein [Amycolatopsis kentuckyensis]
MADPLSARAVPGGLVCPVVTPVSPEGKLEAEVFARHLDSLVPHVEGVFVLGSSGEHPWLPDEVEREVVVLAGEQLPGRVTLYVGAGQADLDGTLRAFERFADSAADYLVITPPTYFPLSDTELVDGLLTLADRAPRPVLLYNIPQFAGNAISPEVLREVAPHPAVVGIKDSSGDLTRFAGQLRARPPGFRVLQGRDHLIAPSLRLGADGAVAGLANIAAPLLRELVAARTDDRRLDALQAEVDELAGIFSYGGLVAALKAGLELRGLPVGSPRRPARPASSAARERIAAMLQDFDRRGHLIPEFA